MYGSIFEVLVYGYILLQGASLLSDGSELLLEILNPGLIGGGCSPPPRLTSNTLLAGSTLERVREKI